MERLPFASLLTDVALLMCGSRFTRREIACRKVRLGLRGKETCFRAGGGRPSKVLAGGSVDAGRPG